MSTFPNQKHNTPVIKLNQPDDNYKFQPLPKPSGEYPYHLSAENLLSTNSDELVFHMVGDTGGRLNPDFQKKVAAEMTRQFDGVIGEEGNPASFTIWAMWFITLVKLYITMSSFSYLIANTLRRYLPLPGTMTVM
jgi:hypothetical protein